MKIEYEINGFDYEYEPESEDLEYCLALALTDVLRIESSKEVISALRKVISEYDLASNKMIVEDCKSELKELLEGDAIEQYKKDFDYSVRR